MDDDAKRLAGALRELDDAVAKVAALVSDLGGRTELVTAESLGIPTRTLRRLVAEGALEGYTIARTTHVRRADWEMWLATQRMGARSERPPKTMPTPPRKGNGATKPKVRKAPSTPTCADDDFRALTAGAAE